MRGTGIGVIAVVRTAIEHLFYPAPCSRVIMSLSYQCEFLVECARKKLVSLPTLDPTSHMYRYVPPGGGFPVASHIN